MDSQSSTLGAPAQDAPVLKQSSQPQPLVVLCGTATAQLQDAFLGILLDGGKATMLQTSGMPGDGVVTEVTACWIKHFVGGCLRQEGLACHPFF